MWYHSDLALALHRARVPSGRSRTPRRPERVAAPVLRGALRPIAANWPR